MNLFKNIDIFWLMRKVWADRRRLTRNCIIAAIVALIIAFSIPRTYTCKVVLAPESSKASSLGSLSSLASLAGVNLQGAMSGGDDAIYPELYPEIINSPVFMAELYSMNVKSGDGEIETTLFDYLKTKQKQPWWGYIFELPLKLKALFVSSDKGGGSVPDSVNYYSFSEGEMSVINKLKKLILCSVDVGNNVITMSATMQDAEISAQVADRLAAQLQEYVTRYRTGKSLKDYEYALKLYEEAKADYDRKHADYAHYMDSHALGTIRNVYKIEEERLSDEASLAYAIYNQMAQQKELARAKVQERTPVFWAMQPAVVPYLPSAPSKKFIFISIVFLTFFGHIAWLLVEKEAKEILKKQKKLRREKSAAAQEQK